VGLHLATGNSPDRDQGGLGFGRVGMFFGAIPTVVLAAYTIPSPFLRIEPSSKADPALTPWSSAWFLAAAPRWFDRIGSGAHRRIKGLRLVTAYGIAAMLQISVRNSKIVIALHGSLLDRKCEDS